MTEARLLTYHSDRAVRNTARVKYHASDLSLRLLRNGFLVKIRVNSCDSWLSRIEFLHALGRDEILIRLSAADDFIRAAIHQHLRQARAVVVVAAHREPVRAGGENRQ